ncbi:hypothetical protein AUR64_14275 [Haloprofundus marisrubri]|uniref:DUF8163 domain-containing protein n=1 Tax=Haloprofundus marisrubri TaxID=1514971 RepID=A0A0W1R6D5_9EURY|nr:hypothetical protein AUR64_14275 [Haloprofundus marisrubri]
MVAVITSGVVGVGIAVLSLLVAIFMTAPIAYATGALMLLALPALPPFSAAVMHLGLGLLLFCPLYASTQNLAASGVVFVLALAGLTVVFVFLESGSVSIVSAAALLAGLIGFVGYTIHRYERVRLGLVTATENTHE